MNYCVFPLLLAAIEIAAANENLTWHDMGDSQPGYEFAELDGSLSWYEARLECRRVSDNTADLPHFESCDGIRRLSDLLEANKNSNRSTFYVKRHKHLFPGDGTWCSWCSLLPGEPVIYYSEDCFAIEFIKLVDYKYQYQYKIININCAEVGKHIATICLRRSGTVEPLNMFESTESLAMHESLLSGNYQEDEMKPFLGKCTLIFL